MSADSKKSQIQLSDFKRLAVGDAPFAFLWEVALRSLIMFAILAVVLRLMGKRMGGQISNLELAVMMTLGAVISLPIQSLDSGILPALAVLLVLLGLQRAVSAAGTASQTVEELTQGRPSILVRDGVLVLQALRDARISRRQLYATLRTRGIRHLGEVKRVYLESGGIFSIFRMPESRTGLSILPIEDANAHVHAAAPAGPWACESCGAVTELAHEKCPTCAAQSWTEAVREPP